METLKFEVNDIETHCGTVIEGTHVALDLLRAFVKEANRVKLADNDPENAAYHEASEWVKLADSGTDKDAANGRFENLENDMVHDLMTELTMLAPDGIEFGAHPNDGADFGWWLTEDE